MEAPAASLCKRWQVVQSLAPINSRPFSSAADAAAGAGVAAESFLDPEEAPELHANMDAEPIANKRIVFFIVA
jgi:hypothetical protein